MSQMLLERFRKRIFPKITESVRPMVDSVLKDLEKELDLLHQIDLCQDCPLNQTCSRKVPGMGPMQADIMFVGEAPDEVDEQQGVPFVGPAGQLMNRAIEAIGWKREDVYITHVVKCRPPENRAPHLDEIGACYRHLIHEIELVRPKVIICWGETAARTLIYPQFQMEQEHGKWFQSLDGYMMIGVYHPSYLLQLGDRTPEQTQAKWQVFNTLKLIKEYQEKQFQEVPVPAI